LGQQQEWVLSDVIDVIRRALLSQTQAEDTAGQLLSSDAVLSSAFEQMLHWGAPHAASGINCDGLVGGGRSGRFATASTGFTWRSLWQSIKRIVKGELRLKWVEPNGPAPLPHLAERSVLITASPIIVAALSPAPMPPSLDQIPTPKQQPELDQPSASAQDQAPIAPQPLAPDQPRSAAKLPVSPSITAHLLGTFSFSVNDATVQNWPTGKGRAVLKYLLAHHDQPTPRDVLMDMFWPQAGPEAARNSLNVALHGLRQALKSVTDKPVVLFEEGAYCLNPEFQIWIDVDEFDHHVQAARRLESNGQVTKAAAGYEVAIGLYQGDFLASDPYEEWPVLPRERYRVAYLDMLDRLSQIYFNQSQYADCIALCQLALTRDACREDTHCLLMRCYSRQGQRQLALRQYQICVEALRAELEVDPAPETTLLHEQIRRRERV
jgi:DNA-binding SARP family transcriptional activator